MIAVILPDEVGSYSYYLERKICCSVGCNLHHTNKVSILLGIINSIIKMEIKEIAMLVQRYGVGSVVILRQ